MWLTATGGNGIPELRISRHYSEGIEGENTAQGQGIYKEKLDSANWFIEAVKQRRVTMVNVMRSHKHQPEGSMGI